MQPCRVEARFTAEGHARPSKIIWEEQELLVTEQGRRWYNEDGQHLLVKVADGRTFELLYNGTYWSGKIVSIPPQFT